ncbi:MAG TPA: CehA/McbA family metallohydrolase [Solirubrobacterales bacterium]|nr:CehA/McbA family metallohydrolase [Solirubrobacterales bacterium]
MSIRRRGVRLAGVNLALALGALAAAPPAAATAPACAADAMLPNRDYVFQGDFGPELQGSYVMLPFDVPAGTDAVRVKYCHDQPLIPDPQGLNAHTIDMGIYDARSSPGDLWDEDEFRGWGGSSRPDTTISPEGLISTTDPAPSPVGTDKTTVGYLPGPIPEGQWAVELGVAAVGQEALSQDGKVNWRVEVDLIDDPSYSDEPYQPVPYDTAPANPNPGWYAGDFHVHARNSNPDDAPMRRVFNYAFCPDPALGSLCDDPNAKPGAGLDFITLSDYVTTRSWGEIGAFQPDYPGHLIIRSAEVITYRGHTNNHASVDFADYRTGPIYEAQLGPPSGSPPTRTFTGTSLMRAARPASEIFDEVHAAGGWTQLNHVQTFPSEVPTFGNFCRGCSWDYSDQETDYSKVDAIEIATGPAGIQDNVLPNPNPNPGPNPFTLLAIEFYEHALDAGGTSANHIAAVGSSDSHNAGATGSGASMITQSPIGQATTVVRADELSEKGIQHGVEAGHTYVKIWGNDGPDLRLEAAVPGSGDPPAIMGDTVRADQVDFTATVKNLDEAMSVRPGAYTLFVVRNGLPFLSVPIPAGGDEFSFSFPSVGPSRYRLQVDRTATGVGSIEAVSSPIYVESPAGGPAPPSAAINDVGVIEGDSGTRDATFTVSISNPAPGPVSVDYDTADGTATAGEDYESRGGIITFQPGETSKQVRVPVLGDTVEEPDESFSVDLSNPAGVSISKSRGTGVILDDEGAPPGPCAQYQIGTDNGEELFGTELSDLILGNGGDDVIAGGPGADCLDGGAGDDEVDGEGGKDRVGGGDGDDRLLGGNGHDRVKGLKGDDRIRVRGGGRDAVRCGPGKDRVTAGPADRLHGCERVR